MDNRGEEEGEKDFQGRKCTWDCEGWEEGGKMK